MNETTANTVKRQRIRGKARHIVSYPDYVDRAGQDAEWVEQSKRAKDVEEAKKSKGGPKERFPFKLMEMLERLQASEHSSVIRFQPHGRAFKVYDKKFFASKVLPHFFKLQTDYASFLRQLNQYGFLRLVGKGPDQDAYYHELFLRGRLDLCELIPRHRDGARNTVRSAYDPMTEPKFYIMAPLPDFVGGLKRLALQSSPKDPPRQEGKPNTDAPKASVMLSFKNGSIASIHSSRVPVETSVTGKSAKVLPAKLHQSSTSLHDINALLPVSTSCGQMASIDYSFLSPANPPFALRNEAVTSLSLIDHMLFATERAEPSNQVYDATPTSFSLPGNLSRNNCAVGYPESGSTGPHGFNSIGPFGPTLLPEPRPLLPYVDSMQHLLLSTNRSPVLASFEEEKAPNWSRHVPFKAVASLGPDGYHSHQTNTESTVSCVQHPIPLSETGTRYQSKSMAAPQLDPSVEAIIKQMEPESLVEMLDRANSSDSTMMMPEVWQLRSSSSDGLDYFDTCVSSKAPPISETEASPFDDEVDSLASWFEDDSTGAWDTDDRDSEDWF